MCIRCNHALAEEAKFCGECAVSQDTSILCKNCSRSIPWDAKFCFYCGQKTEQVEKTSNKTETDVITSVGKPASVAVLEMPVSKAASEKKILAALLLALFFGGFGAHRFYVGKTDSGGGMVALTILSLVGIELSPAIFVGIFVWVIIDIINIIVGNFEDKWSLKLLKWV